MTDLPEALESPYLLMLQKGASKIPAGYFRVAMHSTTDVLKGERVIAYELYHQIRNLQGRDGADELNAVVLHAEVDKGRHPDAERRFSPDLLFHAPGMHARNALAVELKASLDPRGIRKDIRTLRRLRAEPFRYDVGALAVFGKPMDQLAAALRDALRVCGRNPLDGRILVVAVPEKGRVIVGMLENYYSPRRQRGATASVA